MSQLTQLETILFTLALLCAGMALGLMIDFLLRRLLGGGGDELTVHWILGPEETNQPRKEDKTMQINITKGYRRKLTANPTRKDGSSAPLDGALNVRVITGEATGSPVEGDPLSIYINGTGAVGDSVLEAYADARLGPEQREITLRLDVSVRDPEAENLGLVLSDEELIPVVPEPAAAAPTA
jgi:hypothetical protein